MAAAFGVCNMMVRMIFSITISIPPKGLGACSNPMLHLVVPLAFCRQPWLFSIEPVKKVQQPMLLRNSMPHLHVSLEKRLTCLSAHVQTRCRSSVPISNVISSAYHRQLLKHRLACSSSKQTKLLRMWSTFKPQLV